MSGPLSKNQECNCIQHGRRAPACSESVGLNVEAETVYSPRWFRSMSLFIPIIDEAIESNLARFYQTGAETQAVKKFCRQHK